jgi:hypothetical protein
MNGDVHERPPRHAAARHRTLRHKPLRPRSSKPAGLAPHPQRACPAPDLLDTRPRFITPRPTPRGNRFGRQRHPPGDPIGQVPPRTSRPSLARTKLLLPSAWPRRRPMQRVGLGDSAGDWSRTCNVCRANERCDGCETGSQRSPLRGITCRNLLGRVAEAVRGSWCPSDRCAL